MNTSTT